MPYISTNNGYVTAKGANISTNEPYMSTKEALSAFERARPRRTGEVTVIYPGAYAYGDVPRSLCLWLSTEELVVIYRRQTTCLECHCVVSLCHRHWPV